MQALESSVNALWTASLVTAQLCVLAWPFCEYSRWGTVEAGVCSSKPWVVVKTLCSSCALAWYLCSDATHVGSYTKCPVGATNGVQERFRGHLANATEPASRRTVAVQKPACHSLHWDLPISAFPFPSQYSVFYLEPYRRASNPVTPQHHVDQRRHCVVHPRQLRGARNHS